jgi:cation diffusion facilitator family transporter
VKSAWQAGLRWLGLHQAAVTHGHAHHHGHADASDHVHGHGGHTHGAIDPTIATTEKGIWAIKWSVVLLMATAILQIGVVLVSGSVALLADTIHNLADATTALPLWLAFRLARMKPTRRFPYGFGRAEDLAGLAVVLIILFSAIVAGYEALDRLVHPRPVTHLGWLFAAGLCGFLGNEAVAVLRIRTGRAINSAALVADGYHARVDGLTSVAVALGALGVWLGFPLADPVIGLVITVTIFVIVWQSARMVGVRILDGVEPAVLDEIAHAASHVDGARLAGIRARWIGHRLHADLTIVPDPALPVAEALRMASALEHELAAHIAPLASVTIQFARG